MSGLAGNAVKNFRGTESQEALSSGLPATFSPCEEEKRLCEYSEVHGSKSFTAFDWLEAYSLFIQQVGASWFDISRGRMISLQRRMCERRFQCASCRRTEFNSAVQT